MVVRELLIAFGVVTDSEAVDDFDKRIESASKHMDEAGAAAANARGMIADLLGWFAKGVVAVAGFTGALVANSISVAADAQEIGRQAEALGLTTDAYQELTAAAADFGLEGENVAEVLGKGAIAAKAAIAGGAAQVDAFAAIGIAARDLKGKNPEAVLYAVADGLAATKDETTRITAATALFGDNIARKVLPMLSRGGKGLDAFRKQARDLGLVIGSDDVDAAEDLAIGFKRLRAVFEGVRREVGIALVPVLTELVGGMLEYVEANRKAISSGIEAFAKRVSAAFRKLRDVVLEVDQVVRTRLGGWSAVLSAAAAAVGVLVAGFTAFKVGGALYYGFVALDAVISAVAVALGTTALTAAGSLVAVLGGLLGAVLIVVGAFGELYLTIDDLLTYLNGGKSVIGSFFEAFRDAPGVLGEIVRAAEAAIRILVALGTIAKDVGGFFVDVLGAGIDLVANGLRGWILLFDYLVGTSIRNFTAALAESGIGTFADVLERIAGGFETIAGIPPAPPRAMGGIDLGETAITGMRPPPPPAAPSSSSSTTNNVGGNTYQITGADPVAVVNEIDRREGARRRAAVAGFAGADL